MIKPGKNDIKTNFLIQGEELHALQEIAAYFTECFGLDDRIYNYKGNRPLGLYRWDFDHLLTGIDAALEDSKTGTRLTPDETLALTDLFIRLKAVCKEVHPRLAEDYQ